MLWQKERLLNIAIQHLPKRFTKVAWLDSDILFINPNWYFDTESLLELKPVVQLFDRCHWLNYSGSVEKSRPSSAKVGSYFSAGSDQSHPGFAWAAQRDQIEEWGGLFDQDVTGSGDAWMAHAFFGEYNTPMIERASPMMRNVALDWCRRYQSTESISVVSGDVLHMYHGDLIRRDYWNRFLIQQRHNFDPTNDIKVAKNGAWEWTTPKPSFHQEVQDYFQSRKEDEK